MTASGKLHFGYTDEAPDAPDDPTTEALLYPLDVAGEVRWRYTDEAGDEQVLPVQADITTAVAAEAALARNADNLTSGTVADARIAASIARDSEVTAAVAAEAALARNADNLTSGTVADARIASTIARDSEVTAAVAAEATARDSAIATAIANLIASAPGALDTLDELAAAMGDDANFATTITNALALKADLASPALTGNPTAPNQAAGTNNTRIANTAYADAKVAESLTNGVTGIAPSQDVVFDALALKADLASPALTGNPTAPTQSAGTNNTRLATTAYADALVADAINNGTTAIAPSQNAVFDALALKQDKATFPVTIGVALSDETTAITTGTSKAVIRAPFAFTLTAVRASLTTASSSGTPTVDINESGTTVLSTKLTIDANELTSTTAAAAAVISDSAIADDAEITFDIDVAGTGAKGLKVWLIGTRSV